MNAPGPLPPGRGEAGEAPAVNDGTTAPIAAASGGPPMAAPGVPTAILKAAATKSPAPAAELLRTDAGDVAATTVTLERSGADQITAERVIMNRSGAKQLDARSAQLDRSGVMALKGEHVVLHDGSAITITAGEARLVKSRALFVTAGSATIEGGQVLVHVGPRDGNVRPVVDAAGAASFGAALGLVLVLLGALVRRFRRG